MGNDSQENTGWVEIKTNLQQQGIQELITAVSGLFLDADREHFQESIQDMLRAIVDHAGADRSFLYLVDANDPNITAVSTYPADRLSLWDKRLEHITAAKGEGICRRLQGGEPVLLTIPDEPPPTAEPAHALWRTLQIRDVLYIPLLRQGQVLGCLGYVMEEGSPAPSWQKEDASLLKIVGGIFINAFTRYQAEGAAARQSLLAESMREIALDLSTSLKLEDVVTSILKNVGRFVPHTRATLFMVEEKKVTHYYELKDEGGQQTLREKALGWPLVAYPLWLKMYESRKLVVVHDTEQNQEWVENPERPWIRSFVGMPIFFQKNKLLGFLTLASHEPRFFTLEHAARLRTFATQAAIAIQNAKLFALEQRRRQEIEAVQKASFSLISSLDLPHVLDEILQTALILAPFKDANIFLVKDERLVFGAAIAEEGRLNEPFAEPRPGGLTHTVLRTGQTIVVADSKYHPLFRDAPPGWGRFAIVGLPLKMRGDIVGVMNAAFNPPAPISESDRRILNLLATYAAVAIHNARQHKRSQQLASELEERVANRTDELRREHNLLRTVLDSAADGIHFSDTEGMIQYVNPATEQITGYDAKELINERPTIWRGTTAPEIIAEQEQCWMQGKLWQGEVINQRKDGTLYNAYVNISPVLNDEGEVAGYVGVQRDITHMKELEQLKNQFVSRIGHELRTPLANIKLYLDLLDRKDKGENGRYLAVLQTETERLARLVTGFLEISHLNAESGPRHLQSVNLEAVLVESVAIWQPLLARRQLQLITELHSPPPVQGDSELIAQVLNKLLDNAANFTPAAGKVVISASQQTGGKETWVTITVQDTGPGIRDEETPRIFERFFRGEAARDFRVPGAGLGLAFCQDALATMKGKITARRVSDEGGASFTVWLRPV